jgi:DNA polymerase III subunit alpha
MSTPRFTHLHTHSHYSLLSALPTVDELIARAKEYGMDALALTDAGNLYGAVDFYMAAQKAGIKPIIGIDAYLAPRTRFDTEPIDKPRSRLVLLAKNNEGYKNLIKLVTHSYTEGFYYKPRIDREILTILHRGIVCIVPSFAGEPAQALKDGDSERAGATLSWYRELFGDDCFVEITHHPEIPGHEKNQQALVALAKKHHVPLIAAHDVYYLDPDDRKARETMVKIQTGGTVDGGMDDREEDFSFITPERALELFVNEAEAIENTNRVADMCNVTIDIGTWYFPDYTIESGKSPDEELRDLAYAGVPWRGLSIDDEIVRSRLEYELSVIKGKGYAKYFLVVGDLLREARKRKILTTIRGSVAGSLTTYVLGITNVNPLEYKLPFERFLNPERPSAPDIDMDYADNRRDEIIEYARNKYGVNHVAQIGTFGTMMARAAVRDVARALGHPYTMGDTIAKLIPMGSQGFPMTLERALELEDELRSLYKKDREVKEVIDLAQKIEGKVRHISVHAAGVVISPVPLTELVPLQPDPKEGKLITQYDMYTVGEDGVGLLKFDFLGIKNLSILADAVKRVEKIRGVTVDIENIPLDDTHTFEMLARGETVGLFQLNGSGMTRFLKELKPTSIHDINAMVALYRPGPMESIPQYIARKHNARLVKYLDPRLATILDRSYGVVTYQDDVLMIAITLAGYSWLEADKLRKAMGKKIPEVMEAEREKLLKGFAEYGKLSREKAEQLWKLIEPFAAYGFNKAHAASYGKVAYQTAYMKANFPEEYMSAVLTADSGDVEAIAQTIAECERMGITILPPDINESFSGFSVVPGEATIRFGLTTIKNFGEGIADAIIEERKQHGIYASLSDFLRRVQNKNLNKKSLESLVMAGALDRFTPEDGGRVRLLHNVEAMLLYNRSLGEARARAQDSLFGNSAEVQDIVLAKGEDAGVAEQLTKQLSWEKELLGIYVSGHPLEAYKDELQKRTAIKALKTDNRQGIPVVVAGIVDEAKQILTKRGDSMAFLKVSDLTDTIEVVVFSNLFKEKKDVCVPQRVVAVKGRYSLRNGTPSIVADGVKGL